MPLDQETHASVEGLNARFAGDDAAALQHVLDGGLGQAALVSSFGADSAVLLHLVAQHAPDTPVLFIDTLMLFDETLEYQQRLARDLGLADVRRLTPRREALFARDPDGVLHLADPDACCTLRKTEVLDEALVGIDVWITGRKRFQGGLRADLALFEQDGARIKLNPLAGWDTAQIAAYMDRHALPRHPLVARGYPSIGCAPCTGPVAPGEDLRAGRWRGRDKLECGIHVRDGRVIRGNAA
ncbi:MAG: phosphoadenylyl-sulfate reductase [Pararhodobacter sp.]